MGRRKKPYLEGDWFLVPLDKLPGAYGVGLVARVGRYGDLFGYFFGPAVDKMPSEAHRSRLRPADAVYAALFSDVGLVDDSWPLTPRLSVWSETRALFQIPEFGHIDMVDPNLAFGRRYDAEDPSTNFVERPITLEEAQWMPKDGFAGHLFVQAKLTKLLAEGDRPEPGMGGRIRPTIWPEEM